MSGKIVGHIKPKRDWRDYIYPWLCFFGLLALIAVLGCADPNAPACGPLSQGPLIGVNTGDSVITFYTVPC